MKKLLLILVQVLLVWNVRAVVELTIVNTTDQSVWFQASDESYYGTVLSNATVRVCVPNKQVVLFGSNEGGELGVSTDYSSGDVYEASLTIFGGTLTHNYLVVEKIADHYDIPGSAWEGWKWGFFLGATGFLWRLIRKIPSAASA